jgi:hypothetical protein
MFYPAFILFDDACDIVVRLCVSVKCDEKKVGCAFGPEW